MRKIILAFSLLLMGMLGTSTSAFAGLSVTPGIIEMIASPGSEASGTCKIKNMGKEVTRVSIEPENWKQGLKGMRRGDVKDWLSLKPLALELKPGEEGSVTYQVRVPDDASGEYTAQIFCSEQAGGGSTEIHARVGIILYVAVRDTIRLEAEISHASLSAGRDGNQSVLIAQVSVKNTGNVHIRPTGKMQIYDPQGKFVEAIVLKTGWGILPEETYTYQGTARMAGLKPGKYKAVATVDYGKLFKQDKAYTKELFFEVDAKGVLKGQAG